MAEKIDWKARWKTFENYTNSLDPKNFNYEHINSLFNDLKLEYVLKHIDVSVLFTEKPFWRVRDGWTKEESGLQISSFGSPPPAYTSVGRANREHEPVFYCSELKLTAMLEARLGKNSNKEKSRRAYLSKWVLKSSPPDVAGLKVRPFINYNQNSSNFEESRVSKHLLEEALLRLNPEKAEKLKTIEGLMAESFLTENSTLTSWISHEFIYNQGHRLDGISYPSQQMKGYATNFAFHPNFEREHLQLSEVYYFEWKLKDISDVSVNASVDLLQFGERTGNSIKWHAGDAVTQQMKERFVEGLGS